MVINPPAPKGRALFFHYEMKIRNLMRSAAAAKEMASEKRVERFWQVTWPALMNFAQENDMTVEEMFREPMLLVQIYTSQLGSGTEQNRLVEVVMGGLLKDMAALQNMKVGGKLKATHWERVPRVMAGLHSLMELAFQIEKIHLDEPTFDPIAELEFNNILRVLDSLDDSILDAMSLTVEEQIREWNYEHRRENIKSSPAVNLVSESSADASVTISAPAVKPVGQETISPSNELKIALKQDIPLSSATVYLAVGAKGEKFTVHISQDIVEDDRGNERYTLRKLLKSIIHGAGGSVGIKTLFDIGPNIIELKARVEGHKRVIGCLDGRTLYLKSYGPMPTSRAGYARSIPADLCR